MLRLPERIFGYEEERPPMDKPGHLADIRVGMTLMFKTEGSETLAGIPGKVIEIWPRFRSGDRLVTLEYMQPVKFRKAFITHIDAFVSELCQPDEFQLSLQAVARGV